MGPQELGRQLRRARQHLGYSLRDVHAITAIPLPCLAALEEGDLAQLPSPVYARGYIRSYAEAVRLDGDRLALDLWRALEEAPVPMHGTGRGPQTAARPRGRAGPPPPTAPPAKRAPRPSNGRRPSNLATLRQPSSPWVPKPGRLQRMAPGLERAGVVVLLIVLAVGIWDLQRSRPVKKPKAPSQASIISQTAPNAAPTPPPTAPPAGSLSTTPVADTGSLATYSTGRAQYAVVVQATDAECWIQVRSAPGGPIVFQGTLPAGQSQQFPATGTLWVRIGNLGHASVLVDGTPLVLPNKPSFPYNVVLRT